MPVVWGNKTGRARIQFSTPKQGVGNVLGCSAPPASRGERAKPEVPSGSPSVSRAVRGGTWPHCVSEGSGGRRQDVESPASEAGATRAPPRQGSRSRVQPAVASTCCWSPTTPSRCCPSAACRKRPGRGRLSICREKQVPQVGARAQKVSVRVLHAGTQVPSSSPPPAPPGSPTALEANRALSWE